MNLQPVKIGGNSIMGERRRRSNGAVTGAELARLIYRGIAERAERVISGGW